MFFLKNNTKIKGFTLIELLVVVAIIGLLSSVVLASLNGARTKARDVRRMSDLRQIQTAFEMYYNDHGYYPGDASYWDQNAYYYSYDSSWVTLATYLAPYISPLPKDPLNTGNCPPWQTGCYTYTYGNIGKTTHSAQYDLTTQLEDSSSPYRCGVKSYKFFFDNAIDWCGSYSSQIYEASN